MLGKMENKYNLTLEQNIFLAKRNLVDNIYAAARLEGLNVTFPQTKTVLEGVNVPNLKIDEIQCILNLRDAWKYILNNIEHEFNLEFVCKVNEHVSRNESLEWGTLRKRKSCNNRCNIYTRNTTRRKSKKRNRRDIKNRKPNQKSDKIYVIWYEKSIVLGWK